ncbi:methyl-accepting chemotaxis protein [Bdellovibrio sp. SKB1291214]|uniref:methyl-accepting chemotaxis protein n=1 Tax=Bdellovibrio sp. SKB1291214 TaxID=1732569 RepID=UPI000B51A146|nr:methyl-accepting chemotaxis protein [Bdellovibrio sp. SKB1291214]UYL09231.1 methyl-accepting chemotaxis protein [Bdellovibrio sp. SKB1291214]
MDNNSLKSWFRGIKGKLLFAAILPIAGFAVIFGLAYAGLGKLDAMLTTANTITTPNLIAVGELRQSRNKFNYFILASLRESTAEKRNAHIKIAREALDEYFTAYKEYSALPSPAEIADTDDAGDKVVGEFVQTMKDITDLVEKNTPETDAKVLALMDGKIATLTKTMSAMTDASIKYFEQSSIANTGIAKEAMRKTMTIMTATTVATCLAVFALLMFIAVSLSKTVGNVASRLTDSSHQVSAAVVQLNSAGNTLSQSSTEAAASLEETVAALEELTSMVQMNSDNAKQAAALSASSREAAESGENDIKNLISAMTEISHSSKKIEEIISVIDDIAFQTNLLALNAAVEAARAGEQGKGFAVVADAVRTLAQRSATSAKDISSLIKDSVAQIDSGSKIADQSGTVLANIVNSIKKVSDLNNEIAAASSEQTTGIQQISKAMNQLDQSSQSNAASAEEIAATSGEIGNLAHVTDTLTAELTEVVIGKGAVPTETESVKHEKPKTSKKVSQQKSAKVIEMKKPAAAKSPAPSKTMKSAPSSSAELIPFDEDDRKIGTTDGF